MRFTNEIRKNVITIQFLKRIQNDVEHYVVRDAK